MDLADAFLAHRWTVELVLDPEASVPPEVLDMVVQRYAVVRLTTDMFLRSENLASVTAIGFFSRGSIINQFRHDFEAAMQNRQETRPAIFTGFNGLSFERSEEGIAWRLGYDIIALNGPRDEELMRTFVAYTPFAEQKTVVTGIRAGTPQVPAEIRAENSSRKILVFAEQVVVPSRMRMRKYLVTQLIRLARCNPDWDIVIKCRVQKSEATFHHLIFDFEDLLKDTGDVPENLSLSYTPLPELLKNCHLFATVSSTAVFDALSAGIPSVTLGDFGVRNDLGTHIFANSGMMVTLSDIDALEPLTKITPDTGWLRWIGAKDAHPATLITQLENLQFACGQFSPSYYRKGDAQRLAALSTVTVSDQIKAGFRIILAFMRRLRHR
jgi:hypothetical protein